MTPIMINLLKQIKDTFTNWKTAGNFRFSQKNLKIDSNNFSGFMNCNLPKKIRYIKNWLVNGLVKELTQNRRILFHVNHDMEDAKK